MNIRRGGYVKTMQCTEPLSFTDQAPGTRESFRGMPIPGRLEFRAKRDTNESYLRVR